MQCIVTLRVAHGLLYMQANNTATKSCNNQQFEFCLLPGIRQVYTVQFKLVLCKMCIIIIIVGNCN